MSQFFSVYPDAPGQHHPFFHSVVIRDQPVQRRLYILFLNLRKVSQMAQIDPQERDLKSRQLSGGPQKSPVSAQHQDSFHFRLFQAFVGLGAFFLFFADCAAHAPGLQIIRNLMG